MKKRVVSLVLCMALALSVTACGSSKETDATSTESSSQATAESIAEETLELDPLGDVIGESKTPLLEGAEYVLEECLELAEYKGLSFTKTVEPVTEGQIMLKIIQQTGLEGEELTDPDAEVQMGDTAVIMYEGKKDGVPFDGGTNTEPYGLQIGSHSFIDGFEEGLVGMKAGETKDLNLTFPEGYQAEELAGQDVVFTVTVNSIKRLNITDEWVKENASEEFTTAAEYKDSFRKVLEEQNETSAQNTLYAEAWNTVRDNSVFHGIPRTLAESAVEKYDSETAQQAEMYGYELSTLIEAYGKDRYMEEREYYAEYTAKNALLLEALMKAENISKDSEEYQKALEEMVTESGAESAEELIQAYGEEAMDEMLLTTIIVEKILSYGKVTEN